jgi:predicted alpha/beta superfamily hydrolase
MRIILIIALALLFQTVLNAQTNEARFLYQIGTPDSLYSEVLQEQRLFYVQLPPGYSENSNQKYPVVFILDGEVLLPAVTNVQSFYSGGFTPEMVLIGIANDKNRTRDLTPSKITEKYGMPFREKSGGAAEFIRFMEAELIPYIETNYPVTNFRTLIGHSYGGLFTLHTLTNNPELFAHYIAIDPSLDWDDQKLLSSSKEKLEGEDYRGKSLFMSLNGQLHMQNPEVTIDNVMQDTTELTLFPRSNIAFSNLVKQFHTNGLAYQWKFYPMDLHGTIPFPSIKDGLIFNFDWYQMENTDQFNSPGTAKEELADIINYRANKLKEHFGYAVPPYPEDLLNALGYMSLDMEQSEKSKMFFEFGIEFFPDSPNAYESMADYFERNNDLEKALMFVRKAYEISGNEFHQQRMETLMKRKNGGK